MSAIPVLDGTPASIDRSDVNQAYVNVYVSWYDFVLSQDDRNLSRQLELITKALQYGPGNPLVLTLLADLSTREWDGALTAETLLNQALSRGQSPTMVHFILGSRALARGDLETAQLHLELAYERDARMPAVLNNLAWTIMQSESRDLDRALKLIDAALKLEPRFEFSITRADILAQMKRFNEAVVELEGILPQMADQDRGPVHQRLAQLYDELKQPDTCPESPHSGQCPARIRRVEQAGLRVVLFRACVAMVGAFSWEVSFAGSTPGPPDQPVRRKTIARFTLSPREGRTRGTSARGGPEGSTAS